VLGHSVSYFLSQYWRNTPLYAEKLIPLLDTCLSNNFVYSDKVSGAFYELINKYQNTSELPLENLKEFIREQGYGYILDLMVQDEDSIKALWYVLVLVHQLKGSRDGLELVLSLFQENYEPDKISQLELLGEPSIESKGNFLAGKGPTLLTNPLTPVGACLNGSTGSITYSLPEGSYISEAGTYTLYFTNASLESLGKINSIKFTAKHANTDVTTLYENNNMRFMSPPERLNQQFVIEAGGSPIKSITVEYECDFFGKMGSCLGGISIKKQNVTYLPIEGGTITHEGSYYDGFEASKAFSNFEILNTTPTTAGSISIVYPNSLDKGNYILDWSFLGSKELTNFINNFNIGIRYDDWSEKRADASTNTLSIFSSDELEYEFIKKDYSVEFRAAKPFNQIYITYEPKDTLTISDSGKLIISNLGLYKKSNTVTIKTIPNMTSKVTPSGSVVTNATFAEDRDAYKLFNYTSPIGATPTRDGYIKYDYEISERPTLGDYVFTWANSSTDNNAYIKSLDAYITYIDGTQQQISTQSGLDAVAGKTKYFFKFTALNTIKTLTIKYTSTYKHGIGGTFSEANITKTKELESGSGLDVWYESLPVSVENTFTIESQVDIAKTGSEFFNNFKNFIRHYVYPELRSLKVKYSLEGVQAQRLYSISKIIYNSDLMVDKVLKIVTTPEDATVNLTFRGKTITSKTISVPAGETVYYTVSKPYYTTVTGSTVVNNDTIINVPLEEFALYTVTYTAMGQDTQEALTGATYELTSAEGSSDTNTITVHAGTSINYIISHENYTRERGTTVASATETIPVYLTHKLRIVDVENMTLNSLEDTNLSNFD